MLLQIGNGCVIVALPALRVAGHVTAGAEKERVRLDVNDLCVFAAPTDIDLSAGVTWIPTNARHGGHVGRFGRGLSFSSVASSSSRADSDADSAADDASAGSDALRMPRPRLRLGTDRKQSLLQPITEPLTAHCTVMVRAASPR